MKTLAGLLNETDDIDLRKVFPPATNAVNALIQEKFDIIM